MRHRKRKISKLGRDAAHRKSMLGNQVVSLINHKRITTTLAKAKATQRLAEKMVTLGKRGDLHARRQAAAVIRDKAVTSKVFGELADRYRERPGGYTRVIKLGNRVGDAAPVSIVELVDRVERVEADD